VVSSQGNRGEGPKWDAVIHFEKEGNTLTGRNQGGLRSSVVKTSEGRLLTLDEKGGHKLTGSTVTESRKHTTYFPAMKSRREENLH